ncbi:MAG: M48 family metalloprotease [Elusimicrobia bacterium]|nr:M48 family metalloprotease [Elusimicrobiota bacterium]
MGALLTPPVGRHSADVKAAKAFIEKLIENLAGPRLRARGIVPVLNIYASDTVNAFVQETKSGDPFTPENDWKNLHSSQGKPWPIRRLYGVVDSEPMRELGITTALLNRYATQDELAFVIAHELIHLLEGHTTRPDFKTGGMAKHWWSRQQYEVVADAGAIRLMKGKYDLRGAVSVLTDLSRLAPADEDPGQAGTSTHHQPGVRIALAQMAVQAELSKSQEAHQPARALPRFIKLGRMAPRSPKNPNFEKNLASFEMVARAILDDPQASWIEKVDYVAIHRLRPEYSFEDRDPAVVRRFLMAGVRMYSAAPASADHVVVFLKLLLFIHNYYGGDLVEEALQGLTLEEQVKVRYLLARGAGRMKRGLDDVVFDSFNPDSYMSLERLLEGENFQRVLAPLFKVKKWRGLFRLMPRLSSYYNGRKSLSSLRYLLKNSEQEKKPGFDYAEALFDAAGEYMATLGALPENEIEEYFSSEFLDSSLLFYHVLAEVERHRGREDSARWDGLVRAMSPLMKAYMRYRDKTLADFAGRSNLSQQSYTVLRTLANPALRDPRHPPVAAVLEKLQDVLADTIVPWSARNAWSNDGFENPMVVLGEILTRGDLTLERRQRVLAAMLSFQPVHDDEMSIDRQKRVAGFVADYMAEAGQIDYALDLLRGGQIGLLPLLGRDEAQSRLLASRVSPSERRAVLETLLARAENFMLPYVQLDGGRFLLDLFIGCQTDFVDLGWWAKTLDRVMKVSPMALQGREDSEVVLRRFINARLARLSSDELRSALKLPRILKTMTAEEAAAWLFRLLPKPAAVPRAELGVASQALIADYQLTTEFPAVERQLQILMAQHLRLQPGESRRFFPQTEKTATERTAFAADHVRGMSTLIAEIHRQRPSDQIDAIQYLLGRRAQPPAFLTQSSPKVLGSGGLLIILQKVREWASADNPIGRVLVANSILAGPRGVLASPEGENILLDQLLGSVGQDRRDFARELAVGVLGSHGQSRSLAAAYVLGNIGRYQERGATDEQALFKSLLVAHGAPGIKLGQFLAFTHPELRETLGDIQDSAHEFNELDLLEAIEARFGADWPSHYEVVRVLGAGSVNVAVELMDRRSGVLTAMSMTYPDAEAQTVENFRRVDRIIAELTKTEPGEERYGFMRDLLPLIHDSVTLEFDKSNAFAMQGLARSFYDRRVSGWKVQSVPASGVSHMSIFMAKAPGITARRLLESDPKTYRRVMGILSDIEYGLLMGTGKSAVNAAGGLFANPDFHDGQVLVDAQSKTVTILDFGQAVPLSDSDRRLGLRLLRATAKLDAPEAVRNWAREAFGVALSLEEVGAISASADRMGRFVKLVAMIRSRGGRIPIGAVHWVMAVNRQLALSEKIGTRLDWKIGARLWALKLGLLN